jgi:hypothetical protein
VPVTAEAEWDVRYGGSRLAKVLQIGKIERSTVIVDITGRIGAVRGSEVAATAGKAC